MSGPNTELFIKVLAQIEKHPETWDQATFGYGCGTPKCFAGWAVHLSGVELAASATMSVTAERLLGLPGPTYIDCVEQQHLFDADNTFDDLYRISADLLGLDEQVLREKVAAEVADGGVQQ